MQTTGTQEILSAIAKLCNTDWNNIPVGVYVALRQFAAYLPRKLGYVAGQRDMRQYGLIKKVDGYWTLTEKGQKLLAL